MSGLSGCNLSVPMLLVTAIQILERSIEFSGLDPETKRLPIRVRLLAMCGGELSAINSRLMPKCL